VNRIRLGDYKDPKRNFVKAIMNIQVPRKAKNLLAERKLEFEEKLYAMSYSYYYFVFGISRYLQCHVFRVP
jgi:hypothetical protein